MILACHRIYLGLEQGQSQQVCLSPNVAAEKTPWSFCQHCSIRGADLPIHMDSFVTSGLFFSLCFHTTLAWQLSTLPAASSHSMRAPKESPQLSHGLVFICKTQALPSFTAVFKVPWPFDAAGRRVVSSQALSGLLDLTSGENKHWVIFSNFAAWSPQALSVCYDIGGLHLAALIKKEIMTHP